MAYNFDRDKYKKTFESMYGSGAYDRGLSSAREIGRSKAAAEYTKQAYNQALKERQKAEKNKTYSDAITEFEGSETPAVSSRLKDMLENPRKNGASRNEEEIRNDPALQEEIKGLGYSVDEFINAMYNAATDGTMRSSREYKQYAKQTAKDAKNKPKAWEVQSKESQKKVEKKEEKKDDDNLFSAFINKIKKSETDKYNKVKDSKLGKFVKTVEDAFNPFDDVSMKEAVKNFTNEPQSKTFQEVARGANRAVDSASLGLLSNLDKKVNERDPYYNSQRNVGEGGLTDMVTSGVGYLVPGVGSYKALNATKAGKALTELGKRGVGQRLGSEAAKGAITGAGVAGAEVANREVLNPDDYTAGDNLKHLAIGTAAGAIADPAIYGIGKLAQNGLSRFAKGDVPTFSGAPSQSVIDNLPTANRNGVAQSNDLYERLMPLSNQARNVEMQPEDTLGVLRQQQQEQASRQFQEAVDQQYDYLRNSMGQGVDFGTTSNGLAGNAREVTGQFSVSNNPGWYQDFYAQNGRRPNNQELRELAEQHVREGFNDELGSLPAWDTQNNPAVQEIDEQIDQVLRVIEEDPTQEPILRPVLEALEQDKADVLSQSGNSLRAGVDYEPIEQAPLANEPSLSRLNSLKKNVDYEPIEQVKPGKEPPLAKVSPDLLDNLKQMSGSLESAQAKISFEPKKKPKTTFHDLRTQFIDDTAPLENLEKQIAGEIQSAENSLYKQARLFRGSAEKAHLVVNEQLGPILNDLKRNKITPKDASTYALMVHAKDVNGKGINSGFTNAEIEDTIKRLGTPEMEAIRKKMIQVNNNTLDMLSSGENPVLDPAAVEAMKAKWPNYMSLFRNFDDEKVDFASQVSKNMSVGSTPIHKLEGSNRDAIDPFESMIKNIFKATNVSDRNKVAGQLGKLAEKDTTGEFIRELTNGEDAGRLNVITMMDKGKPRKFEVPPDVYKVMKNLDKESTNTLVKILQKPASALRAGATLTPEFSLRNPMRDLPQAFVVSESGFNPLVDFPVGLWQSIWKGRTIKIGNKEFKTAGELYKQFIKENGGYGNIISMDRELHQETLKKALTDSSLGHVDILSPNTYKSLLKKYANPKHPLEALRNIADISETATKVGEFRAATRKGASPQEAAYRARDIMDFARSGVSIREANKVVAFLNANIQGKSKLWRAFQKNPGSFIGKASAAVTIPTIGAIIAQNTYSNDAQRQALDDAPQWLKDTFWLLPIPGTDQIARIPKPFDLSFAFSNVWERAADYAMKNDKEAFDNFIKEGFSQAAIPVMLTGLAPIVEGMANYSFFRQGPIIPQREENLNYPDQYDVNTSEVAKFAGKGIDKLTGGEGAFRNFGSPRVIDNSIQGFFGGLGTYGASAADGVIGLFTDQSDEPEAPEKNIYQKPLAKAFLMNQSSGGESLEKLYSMRERLTKQRGSAKQNEKAFPKENIYQTVDDAASTISEINKEIRSIENARDISGEEKRRLIDELTKQRNEISRKAMNYIENME